jgi:hypothetical protein
MKTSDFLFKKGFFNENYQTFHNKVPFFPEKGIFYENSQSFHRKSPFRAQKPKSYLRIAYYWGKVSLLGKTTHYCLLTVKSFIER